MTQPLRFGLYLPPFGPFGDPRTLVDLAVRAEAAGWDGLFLWDHAATDTPPIADTWTVLAAVAQATDRIRIGPAVTPLSRRRPWTVARQASAVSRLSGGRLVLGAGLGVDEFGEYSGFDEPAADPATRAAMLDEGLDVLRAVWSGRPVHHRGRHYTVQLPAGTPEPHPVPIWTAATDPAHPRVLRRAAACDGIFPNPPDHELRPEEVAAIRTGLRRAGLPDGRPFDLAVRGNASPAWEEEKDVDLRGLAEAGATWWLESLIHFDPLELSLAVVDAGPPAAG